MNGVMMPSVSAGSSQREASVMCTPQVMVPSGAAVAGRARPIRKAIVRSPPTTRETECLMVPPSRGGEYTPAAALLCEPPKDAGVARVGLDHDLLQLAGTSAVAYRRQDDHLAVSRDVDGRVGVDPHAVEPLFVEDECQTASNPCQLPAHLPTLPSALDGPRGETLHHVLLEDEDQEHGGERAQEAGGGDHGIVDVDLAVHAGDHRRQGRRARLRVQDLRDHELVPAEHERERAAGHE